MLTPEYFAHQIASDFDSPISAQFIPFIADAIRKQVEEYGMAIENDPTPQENWTDHEKVVEPVDEEEAGFGDLRIVVKLDIHVGSLYLKDQFEWPLFSTNFVTAEQFARIYGAELGIGGQFVALV